MKIILAVDPGPAVSAYVTYNVLTGLPTTWATVPNEDLLLELAWPDSDELAVEMVSSYGMPVGAEVFETCVWIGRFVERWRRPSFRLIPRTDVKLHLTHQRRAKDSNVRQALIDRYGPGKDAAVGRKATPGPLYGLTGDCWSALALAVTAAETSDVPDGSHAQ